MHRRLTGVSLFALCVAQAASAQPTIRLRLSSGALLTGEPVHVTVKTAEDGHLLVLRMDTDGRIRVLFPVDPSAADQVRGGKEREVRSRGNREAFVVNERAGRGMVLAVRSDQPFRYEAFVEQDRWSLTALTPDSLSSDPEGALLHVVDRMLGGRFDYDAAPYRVGAPLPRGASDPPSRTRRLGLVFGAWNAWSAWSRDVPVFSVGASGFTIGFDFGTYVSLRPIRQWW